jgi:serine protease Do
MSYLVRSGIVVVAVFLACSMALPSSHAQTRAFSNTLLLGLDGAYLGIQMKDVAAGDISKYKLSSERGVIVSSVIKGSPAETAKLKEEDVILEFGGFAVWSSSQLSRLVQETPVGRKVEMVVSRDGQRMNLSATLETRDRENAEGRIEIFPNDGLRPGPRPFQFRMPGPPEGSVIVTAPKKARLGVTVQPLTDQLGAFLGVPGNKGVLVASVINGSPSAGKLKAGDVILSVDGKSIENPDDLTKLIQAKSEGTVNLKVIRDKKEIPVVVNLPASDEKGYKL